MIRLSLIGAYGNIGGPANESSDIDQAMKDSEVLLKTSGLTLMPPQFLW